MEADPAAITERFTGTLSELLGIRFVEATPERVVAELAVPRGADHRRAAASTAAR